jgi:hypothetical protein
VTFDRCDWPLPARACTAKPRYSVVNPRAERPKGLHVCPVHAAVAVQASWNICMMMDEPAPVGAFDELPGTKPRRDQPADELPHRFFPDPRSPEHCLTCGGWKDDVPHRAAEGEPGALRRMATLAELGPHRDPIDDLGAGEPPPAKGGLVPFQCQGPECGLQFMADADTNQCPAPGCHAFAIAEPMPPDDPAAVAGLTPSPIRRVTASLNDMRASVANAWDDLAEAIARIHTAAYDAVRTWDEAPVGSVQVPQQVYTVMATLAAAAGYEGHQGRTVPAARPEAGQAGFQAAAGGLTVELHDDFNIFIRQPHIQQDDELIHVTNVGALRDALEFTRLERDARERTADQNRNEDTDRA